MRIATILFTYKRYYHTKKVLDALALNYIRPSKLFVFQDGLKSCKDKEEWDAVNKLIKGIDFCETEVIVSSINKGLAASITEGIGLVSERYDAFVVLEDDCVPDKNFMGFMNTALGKYVDHKNVYNIAGYSYPATVEENGYDAFFTGRTCSWGWGTWSDRWRGFTQRKEDLDEIWQDQEKSRLLAEIGNDLPAMLWDRLNNRNDSWAVFWSLYVINKGGFCLVPYRSLIHNIGMDGSGVHCGCTDEYEVLLENADEKCYSLPDTIEYGKGMPAFFMKMCGGYTALNIDGSKQHIIVYGLGSYYIKNEKWFSDNFFIEGFVDRQRKGYYAGKKIIGLDELRDYPECKIFVLIMDISEAEKVRKSILKYGIEGERIKVLGQDGLC